ncbi:hypothetical protein B7463_g9944, partial [Scytalidium lignicola]
MTASQNTYQCFSISQPFLGAPLRFEPPLGSKELDDLIEAYIPGPAPRQDKLSEVTIEFYKFATVDINTGSLVRTYNVCMAPAFEQSPAAQSQSSSFSPSLHTPSPGSSVNFTDSGYGTSSFTMTPPVRTRHSISAASLRGAVKKSTAKKERKNAGLVIETQRIPGFSIMTKDGIDVTTSAGRGTKTKEQREHAHLMRIMKACNECKRKKVRCDPSHRLQNTDMSRTSSASKTSTPPSASVKTSSPKSQPPPSIETSQSDPFLFEDNSMNFDMNAMNDFVLFPEGDTFWNPADLDLDVDLASSLPLTDLDSQNVSSAWIPNLDLSNAGHNFTNNQFELMNANIGNQSYYSPSLASQPLDFLQYNGYSSSSSPEEYVGYKGFVDSGGRRSTPLPQSRHPQPEPDAFDLGGQSGGWMGSLPQSPQHQQQSQSESLTGLSQPPGVGHRQVQSSASPPASWPYVPSANANAGLNVLDGLQQVFSSETGVVLDGTYGVSCTTQSPPSLPQSPDLESQDVRRSRAQRRRGFPSSVISHSEHLSEWSQPGGNEIEISDGGFSLAQSQLFVSPRTPISVEGAVKRRSHNEQESEGTTIAQVNTHSSSPSDSGSTSGYESGSSNSSSPLIPTTSNYYDDILRTCNLVIQSYHGVQEAPSQLHTLVEDVRLLQTHLESEKRRSSHLSTSSNIITTGSSGQINAIIQSVNAKLNDLASSILSTPTPAISLDQGLVTRTHLQVRGLLDFFKIAPSSTSSSHRDQVLVLTSGDGSESNPRLLTSGRNVQLLTPLRERYSQERDPLHTRVTATRTSTGSLGSIQGVDTMSPLTLAPLGDDTLASTLQVYYSASPSHFFKPLRKIVQNSIHLQVLDVPEQDVFDLPSTVVSANINTNIQRAENLLGSTATLSYATSATVARSPADGLITWAPLQGVPVISLQEQGEPEKTPTVGISTTSLATCEQQQERPLPTTALNVNVKRQTSILTVLEFTFFIFLTITILSTITPLVSSFLQPFSSWLSSFYSHGDMFSKPPTTTILDIIFKSFLALLISGVSSSSTSSCAPLRKGPTILNSKKDFFSLPPSQTFINLFDILSA